VAKTARRWARPAHRRFDSAPPRAEGLGERDGALVSATLDGDSTLSTAVPIKTRGQVAHARRGAADRDQLCEVAGPVLQGAASSLSSA
jgi:hypothetical protein